MKTRLFSLLLLTVAINSYAQNVGINSTGAAPVTSAALDVDIANKGILIPRVALTTTAAFAPVTGTATTSLLVYNSATAGVSPTNVTPGYYYWNGTAWVRLVSFGTSWELTGNAGTVAGTNFLGTTDAIGLDLRTNNTLRQRILSTGETIFNFTTPFAGDVVSSYASGANSALNGYLTGTGAGNAILANCASTSGSSAALISQTTGGGFNVYARNANTANTAPSILAIENCLTGDGVFGFVGTGAAVTTFTGGSGGTFTHPVFGVYGIARNATNSTGGIFAAHGTTPSTLTTGSGIAVTAATTGMIVRATTATNSFGAYFSGNNAAFLGPATGGAGIAVNSTVIATWSASTGTANDTWGGFFRNANTFAFVGGTTGGTQYKINGPGTVATMVPDLTGKSVNMFCPEAPEVLFQDYGAGKLVNGTVHITIDPILAKNIFVDETHPLKVFVQLEGDCGGVYVTNKTASGFDVVELQGGHSNTSFSWSLVANRIDQLNASGEVSSRFQDVRFPDSPVVPETVESKSVESGTKSIELVQPQKEKLAE